MIAMFRSLVVGAAACAAVMLSMAADTASSPRNLIINGGFEEGKDAPTGWRFSSARMEDFEHGFTHDAASGRRAAHIVCRSDAMSGYWGQTVRVKPHTRYRLTLKVKLESGKVLIYAHGKTLNQRLYLNTAHENPLVPVFVPVKWTAGVVETNRWLDQTMEFDSGDETAITVSFGTYFKTGTVSFDDVKLHEIQ